MNKLIFFYLIFIKFLIIPSSSFDNPSKIFIFFSFIFKNSKKFFLIFFVINLVFNILVEIFKNNKKFSSLSSLLIKNKIKKKIKNKKKLTL
jgi:hypothetical protein